MFEACGKYLRWLGFWQHRSWRLGWLLGLLLSDCLVSGCATPLTSTLFTDSRAPSVQNGDSNESFWHARVRYPAVIRYVSVPDDRGTVWRVAYLDLYDGDSPDPQAPVLVLIHGRGANLGYFSSLMDHAVDAGMRVLAFDLPNYGKSIPGNLDNPVARPLEDTREVIHRVLVDHLHIQKANYLGHSLGGQWVIGYALRYPEAVRKIILESSYGLEEFPTRIRRGDGATLPLFDPAYSRDFEHWQSVWDPLGHRYEELNKSPQEIQAFYYFKQLNSNTGELSPAPLGYFRRDSVDARFLTQVRMDMIDGNHREFQRYVDTYVWDIYALGIEVRREDPQSLYKRLTQLSAPMMMAFGGRDPFLPVTALTQHRDLRKDLIKPAYEQLLMRGQKPQVVIYPEAGHIPHADAADAFAKDVIAFIQGGQVQSQREDPMRY